MRKTHYIPITADVPGAAGNENGHENRSFNSI